MPKAFPLIERQMEVRGDEDYNPSIRLFGRRFFADQTVAELLLEFLIVATSTKRIGSTNLSPDAVLPEIEQLRSWPSGEPLRYAPKARLNLKLFAFLGASKLETRHESHRQHYHDLISQMRTPEKLSVSGSLSPDEVLKTLQNLFLGFQSVGGQRTWCAQAFLPVARNVIGAETLWNETDARRSGVKEWTRVVDRFLHFFSFGRHRFLARGGELLYLQLCNALRQDESAIRAWAKTAGISLSPREADPSQLHAAVERALASIIDACPETVGKLAEFIDIGVEAETAKNTDFKTGTQEPRFASCGWCPEETWPEGMLFAIELLHLCEAIIDPIERIQMFELNCAMQLLRSLCAQSARYASRPASPSDGTGPLGFVWALSDSAGDQNVVKQVSRRNLNSVQRLIHGAVRHPDILSGLEGLSEVELARVYKEADGRYGHKLFLTVAKRIGLIVPKLADRVIIIADDKEIEKCRTKAGELIDRYNGALEFRPISDFYIK